MKQQISSLFLLVSTLVLSQPCIAGASALSLSPLHSGEWISSVLYQRYGTKDDFGSRGQADFDADKVAALIAFGVTDRFLITASGGSLLNIQYDLQSVKRFGRSGFFYGLDFAYDVFPVTTFAPGLRVATGIAGFQAALTRAQVDFSTSLIDQNLSSLEYYGDIVTARRIRSLTSYAGLRSFYRQDILRDNRPTASVARIKGKADSNLSAIVGCSFMIFSKMSIVVEGLFIGETSLSAGLTLAAF